MIRKSEDLPETGSYSSEKKRATSIYLEEEWDIPDQSLELVWNFFSRP